MQYPILLFLILCLLNGCASGKFSVNEGIARFSIPFNWPGPPDKELPSKEPVIKEPVSQEPVIKEPVSKIEGVYVDMPKADLYGLFTAPQLQDYRKEGNEEWITFSAWVTEESTDTVTFYLLDGKVKDWQNR